MVKFEDLQVGTKVFLIDSNSISDEQIEECIVDTNENNYVAILRSVRNKWVTYTIVNNKDYEYYLDNHVYKTRKEAQAYLDKKFNKWKSEIEALSKEQLVKKLLEAWDNEYWSKREYDVMKQKIEKEFNIKIIKNKF